VWEEDGEDNVSPLLAILNRRHLPPAGAVKYWIVDLPARALVRLVRAGDAWREERLPPPDRLSTELLLCWSGVVLGDLLD
jgi:hypothetical protein